MRRTIVTLLMWACASAHAAAPDWKFPAGTVAQAQAGRMWWFGREAGLQQVEIPLGLPQAVGFFIDQAASPYTLQDMPDGVLIAGMAGASQWLVRLSTLSESRTAASLSTFSLSAAPRLPAPPWHPGGARVRLDIAAETDDGLVRQWVLADHRSAAGLGQVLCQRLRASGWRPEEAVSCPASSSLPMAHTWHRAEARMVVVTMAQPAGSAAFVLHSTPSPHSLRGQP